MSTVEIVRGGVLESRHLVNAVVCDAEGHVVSRLGVIDELTYYRSAAKPFQALPLLEEGIADRFGLTAEELALCCASHEGERVHLAGARSILAKAGADESFLRCGPHLPYSDASTRALIAAGEAPRPIHNNCSGKHAGMIALAIGMGWDPEDYHRSGHPVQRRMGEEIARWSGVPAKDIPVGVDGCGVACFAVPLRDMARSFAAFTAAADRGESPARVVDAMTGHPFMVGGSGRTCTDVMRTAGDRVFVKLGAEGVYGGGLRGRGLGFAIKVSDGARRAVEVALVAILHGLGAITPAEAESLGRHGRPPVLNTLGERVGDVHACFDVIVTDGTER